MGYMEPGDDADRSDYAREVAEVMQVEPEPEALEPHAYRVVDRMTGELYMTVLAPDPSLAFERALDAMRTWYFDAKAGDIDILF